MKTCIICGATENETKIIGDYCRKHYLQIKRHGKIIERTIYDTNNIRINGNKAVLDLYDKNGNKIAETIIDACNVDKVKAYKWYRRIHKRTKLEYVMGSVNGKKIFLHRFLLNVPDDKIIDHINGNTLDNTISNLRICTQFENSRNRIYESSKGNFPGVYQQYDTVGYTRWSARICYNYKTIYHGTYDTYEEAVQARLEAEKKYFGEFNVHSGQLK